MFKRIFQLFGSESRQRSTEDATFTWSCLGTQINKSTTLCNNFGADYWITFFLQVSLICFGDQSSTDLMISAKKLEKLVLRLMITLATLGNSCSHMNDDDGMCMLSRPTLL